MRLVHHARYIGEVSDLNGTLHECSMIISQIWSFWNTHSILQIIKDRVDTHMAHSIGHWNTYPGAYALTTSYSMDLSTFPFSTLTHSDTQFTALLYVRERSMSLRHVLDSISSARHIHTVRTLKIHNDHSTIPTAMGLNVCDCIMITRGDAGVWLYVVAVFLGVAVEYLKMIYTMYKYVACTITTCVPFSPWYSLENKPQ